MNRKVIIGLVVLAVIILIVVFVMRAKKKKSFYPNGAPRFNEKGEALNDKGQLIDANGNVIDSSAIDNDDVDADLNGGQVIKDDFVINQDSATKG